MTEGDLAPYPFFWRGEGRSALLPARPEALEGRVAEPPYEARGAGAGGHTPG